MVVSAEEHQTIIDRMMDLFMNRESAAEYGEDPYAWCEANLPEDIDATDICDCMPEVCEQLGGDYDVNAGQYNTYHGEHGVPACDTPVNEISYTYNHCHQRIHFEYCEPADPPHPCVSVDCGDPCDATDIDTSFQPVHPPTWDDWEGPPCVVIDLPPDWEPPPHFPPDWEPPLPPPPYGHEPPEHEPPDHEPPGYEPPDHDPEPPGHEPPEHEPPEHEPPGYEPEPPDHEPPDHEPPDHEPPEHEPDYEPEPVYEPEPAYEPEPEPEPVYEPEPEPAYEPEPEPEPAPEPDELG